ncbi:MAG: hypothetical protein IJ271_07455, partial [Bacteroidales bacterium]|nr:hypothetical protein [Bacteroidales bacterium]
EVSDLTEAVSALQVKLAEDYATKVSVESLKAELNGTIAAEVADLEKAIENATAALNAAINEKADQSDLEAVAKTVADLQADLAEAQKALKDELKAAKDELKAADAANAKAIEDLAARLTAAEKAIENINAAVATLQSDVEALKQGYMENTQALTNLKSAYDNFVEETTVNFTNVKGNIAALDAYVKSMEETLHERIDDVAKSLTMAINLFTDEIDGLKAEDSAIYVAIQEAQTAITNVNNLLDDEADARETEDAKLYLAIQEANASIGSVYTQLLEAKDELSAEIASQVDVVETAVTSVYNQLLDLQVVVAEINDRLTAQEEAFTEHKAVIDLKAAELRGALDALEPIIATLQAQSAELKATLDALSPVIENINAKIAELKMTLDSLSPLIENLYDRDDELKNTIDSLVPVIDNLNEQVTAMVALQERILSIAYVPETLLDSRGVIDFISMYVWNEVEQEYVYVNSAPTTAIYRVNPTKANLEGVEWAMTTRAIKTRATETASISIANVAVGQGGAQGRVMFDLVADGELPYRCTSNDLRWPSEQVLASLVATTPAGDVIYSDEAYAQQVNINDYWLIKKQDWYADNDKDGEADKMVQGWWRDSFEEDEAHQSRYDMTMPYDKTINLNDYVETFAPEYGMVLPELNVYPTYKFTLPSKFIGQDDKTNQQKFVTLAEDGTLSVNAEFLEGGVPAVGRTPIVQVEAQIPDNEGNLVTLVTRYIIIKIVYSEDLTPVEVELNGEFEYSKLLAPWVDATKPAEQGVVALDWETANQKVLDKLSITNRDFHRYYGLVNVQFFDAAGKLIDGPVEVYTDEYGNKIEKWIQDQVETNSGWEYAETSTYPAWIKVNNQINENTAGSVVYTYKSEGRPDVILTFNYSVKHDHVFPEFNPDYTLAETIEDMTVIQVKGKMNADNTGWVMQSEMKEHFKNYLKGYKDAGNHSPLTFFFPIDLTINDATITGTDWTDQEISLNDPLVGEFKDVLVGMYTELANGHICEAKYVVRFVNPFVVNALPVQLKTLIADPDQEDLMDYIKITDVNGTLIYEGVKTNSKIKKNTWYENPYRLNEENVFPTFTCKPDASFGTKLNLSGSLLEWYNGGTDLQQNKTTAYGVKVAISNVSVVEAEAAVTVLSTANSK